MGDLRCDLSVDINGLECGNEDVSGDPSDPFEVLGLEGWDEAADFDNGSTPRQGDGAHPQKIRARDRQVTIRLGLTNTTQDEAGMVQVREAYAALRQAVSPAVDRITPRVVRVRNRGVTQRALFYPASKPVTANGDVENYVYDHIEATVTLWCPDPVIYSDTATETTFTVPNPGTPITHTIVNDGTYAAVEGGLIGFDLLGPYNLTITAGMFGCTNPYLLHVDHPGEKWVLADQCPAGSTIVVKYDRSTYRGGALRLATVQGPGGCPKPIWPVLRQGDNDLRIGCTVGSLTAVLRHRSTW